MHKVLQIARISDVLLQKHICWSVTVTSVLQLRKGMCQGKHEQSNRPQKEDRRKKTSEKQLACFMPKYACFKRKHTLCQCAELQNVSLTVV